MTTGVARQDQRGSGEGAEGIQMIRKNQTGDGVPQKEPESQGRVAAAQDGHPSGAVQLSQSQPGSDARVPAAEGVGEGNASIV